MRHRASINSIIDFIEAVIWIAFEISKQVMLLNAVFICGVWAHIKCIHYVYVRCDHLLSKRIAPVTQIFTYKAFAVNASSSSSSS